MNKTVKKLIAVTLVTATLVSCFLLPVSAASVVPTSGNFGADSKYSNPDKLPYGGTSVIVEINKSFYDSDSKKYGYFLYTVYRFCMSSDSKYTVSICDYNGYKAVCLYLFSNDPIYYAEYSYEATAYVTDFKQLSSGQYNTKSNDMPYFSKSAYHTYTAVYCSLWGSSTLSEMFINSNKAPISSTFALDDVTDFSSLSTSSWYDYVNGYTYHNFLSQSVYPCGSSILFNSGRTMNFLHSDSTYYHSLTYPTLMDTSSGVDVDKIVSEVNANNDKNAAEIKEAIDNAVTEIINVGSDLPELSTALDWMDEALTKVNGWLDSLDDFNDQMDDNLAENEENMNNASNFIKGFFNVVPSALIAVFSLILVMIVVVKVVGR